MSLASLSREQNAGGIHALPWGVFLTSPGWNRQGFAPHLTGRSIALRAQRAFENRMETCRGSESIAEDFTGSGMAWRVVAHAADWQSVLGWFDRLEIEQAVPP